MRRLIAFLALVVLLPALVSSPALAGGYSFLSGPLWGADGSAAAPQFTFAADVDSGMYRIGANNIGIGVNGTKILDIGTTGIGVTGLITSSNGLTVNGALGTFNAGLSVPSGQTLTSAGTTTLNGILNGNATATWSGAHTFSSTVSLGSLGVLTVGKLRIEQSDETANGGIFMVRPSGTGDSFKVSTDGSNVTRFYRGAVDIMDFSTTAAAINVPVITGGSNTSLTVGSDSTTSYMYLSTVAGQKGYIGATATTVQIGVGAADTFLEASSSAINLNKPTTFSATVAKFTATSAAAAAAQIGVYSNALTYFGGTSGHAFVDDAGASVGSIADNATWTVGSTSALTNVHIINGFVRLGSNSSPEIKLAETSCTLGNPTPVCTANLPSGVNGDNVRAIYGRVRSSITSQRYSIPFWDSASSTGCWVSWNTTQYTVTCVGAGFALESASVYVSHEISI